MVDGHVYKGSKTIDINNKRIFLDSEALHASSNLTLSKQYNQTRTRSSLTSCSWRIDTQRPAAGNGFVYELKVNRLEIEGCHSCACGSLIIHEYNWNNEPGKRLGKRVHLCGSKTKEDIVLVSTKEMVIQFQSNSSKPKVIDIQYSTRHRSGRYLCPRARPYEVVFNCKYHMKFLLIQFQLIGRDVTFPAEKVSRQEK